MAAALRLSKSVLDREGPQGLGLWRQSLDQVDIGWQGLLVLAKEARLAPLDMGWCALSLEPQDPRIGLETVPEGPAGPVVIIELDGRCPAVPQGAAVLRMRGWVEAQVVAGGAIDGATLGLLRLYAPYALGSVLARRRGRAMSVSHFAQSLDGRIATFTGDSRWIGNEDNLIHAHRMRALCDGILIGAQTLRRDKPRLNVRRVPGDDPARIVLGARGDELADLLQVSSARLLLVCSPKAPNDDARIEHLQVAASGAGPVKPAAILKALYDSGIHSVYVEGGSHTTSGFLTDNALDVVQLHHAPLILGGGVGSFGFEGVEEVRSSVRFDAHFYEPVGDGVMFVGAPSSFGEENA